MKKNILIFHQNMVMGGVEKVTLNILENLSREKFNIKVVLIEKHGELIEKLPKDLEIIYLLDKSYSKDKKGLIKFIGYLKELIVINKKSKKIIKERDILLNMNARNMRINLLFLKYKNKKIGWIHGNILNDFGKISEKFNYKLFNQYSKIFNISKQGKKDFDDKFPKLRNKSELLYNSFNIEGIIRKSKEEIINEKDYLLSIGRLSYEKGFDLLIDAISLLKKDGIEKKLYIIGDGEEKENLKKQIEKLSLENNVFLLGFKENPYPWLKNSKLYILSSRGEGLPTVLIEALACQKAIVSANCLCGPREILDNGKYGLLVETENSSALKEGIKKLLLDKELKENYENKSLKRAYDFSNENILKKLEREISDL